MSRPGSTPGLALLKGTLFGAAPYEIFFGPPPPVDLLQGEPEHRGSLRRRAGARPAASLRLGRLAYPRCAEPATCRCASGGWCVAGMPPTVADRLAQECAGRRAAPLVSSLHPTRSGHRLLSASHRSRMDNRSIDSAGHARSDGAQDARRDGAAARLRPGAAHRADQRGRAARQPGHHLPLPDPAGAEALDLREVGHLGEQPQGKVLRHHQGGTTAAAWRKPATGSGCPA